MAGARAAAAPRRRRGPEGRGAAVRLATPASTSPARSLRGRRRRVGDHHGLSVGRDGVRASASRSSSTLGFELRAASRAARPRSRSTLQPELCNSWGVAHGGVTMTLLDVAMAHAARAAACDGTASIGRGHHRDEDQLHAARRAAGSSARAGCCTAPPRWRSAKATVYDAEGQRLSRMPPAPSST